MATLYFNAASSYDWADLANWWQDEGCGTQAGSLPTDQDSVVLFNSCTANSGDYPTVVNLTLQYESLQLDDGITVTGVATFNTDVALWGTLTGNCVFNVDSQNWGTVYGNATFNDYAYNWYDVVGNATFNNYAVNYSAVYSSATFNDSASNYSEVLGNAVFNDFSANGDVGVAGSVYVYVDATFNDSSYNAGYVLGSATFNGSSYNDYAFGNQLVSNATFNDLSHNDNDHSGCTATFNDYSYNANWAGTVTHNDFSYSDGGDAAAAATFNHNSYCINGGEIDGPAVFNDSSVAYAMNFYDSATFNDASFVMPQCQIYSITYARTQYPIPRGINGSSLLGVV